MDPIDINGLRSFDTTHAPPRSPTSVTATAAPRPQPVRIYLPPSGSANTRVVYDSANGVNRLAGNSESLVIAITVKGKPSHFSVFFGPDPPFNCKGDVPKSIWDQEVRISLNFLQLLKSIDQIKGIFNNIHIAFRMLHHFVDNQANWLWL